MKKRKLTHICDAGHGWLSVSHQDVLDLGIADKVSAYSYIDATRVYLEEDGDASLYIETAKAAGWQLDMKSTQSKDRSPIRGYANYDKAFLGAKVGVGSILVLHDGRKFRVTDERKSKWLAGGYAFPKRNLFRYVKAVEGLPLSEREFKLYKIVRENETGAVFGPSTLVFKAKDESGFPKGLNIRELTTTEYLSLDHQLYIDQGITEYVEETPKTLDEIFDKRRSESENSASL